MKILVIQQKMIGDVLTSSILFEALREKYPEAELHYMINKNTLPVVQNNRFIDKLVIFSPEITKSRKRLFKFLKEVKNEEYHVVIDVYSKILSGFITYFSSASIRIGLQKLYTSPFYTHTIKPSKANHLGLPMAIYNRLEFLEPLSADINFCIEPKLHITQKERNDLVTKLSRADIPITEGGFIMVNCLGSKKQKTYLLEYMAELLDAICRKFPDKRLFLNYIPDQLEQRERLRNFCSDRTKKQIVNFYAPNLREFIVLTSFCEAVIGNEGGAINIGKALGIKTYSIFSPSIEPSSWMHQDSDFHQYTHLKLYYPELFSERNKKVKSQDNKSFYRLLKPELFQGQLLQFLN